MMKVKANNIKAGKEEKKSGLSQHELDQLRTWMKATPQQRLAWLEEAMQLVAKTTAVNQVDDASLTSQG
jgi:hypothetical protein